MFRIIRNRIDASFAVYALGLTSLIVADLLIANVFSKEVIAEWAVFRSLVGLSAMPILIGLDHVLVRSPQSSARLLRLLAIQIFSIGVVVGFVLNSFGFVSHWSIGSGVAIGSALSFVLFQYFRSHHRRMLSQLAQQSWKILALIVVVWISWSDVETNVVLACVCLLLFADVIGLGFLLKFPPSKLHPQNPEPIADLYAIGSRFMVTALFLGLSVYAEQLVVNRLGSTEEAALYFTSATYLLFPVSFLNGYVAFLIGPWIRENHDKFVLFLGRFGPLVVIIVLIYVSFLNLLGWLGWSLTNPTIGSIDHGLQLIFALACVSRSLYIVPSGYIGVFGRPRQHDILVLGHFLALAAAIGLFLGMKAIGVSLVYSVGIASTANGALRLLTARFVMKLIIRSRDELR